VKLFRNLRRHLPSAKEIQEYRYLHIFGDSLKQAELWTFNRQTTAKGIAIGIFCAFLPMPFEMIPAIFIAMMLRGNLPFAVAGVWISNPLTWVPLYTPCYFLGARILGIDPIHITEIRILELGLHYIALWLGCLIVGITLSISAHFIISFLWRSDTLQRWERRRTTRLKRSKQNQSQGQQNS